MIDLKCGKCNTVFPVKKSEIAKRFSDERPGPHHVITCPSCLDQLPDELYFVIKFQSNEQGFRNWQVGTRFSQVQES